MLLKVFEFSSVFRPFSNAVVFSLVNNARANSINNLDIKHSVGASPLLILSFNIIHFVNIRRQNVASPVRKYLTKSTETADLKTLLHV